VLTLRLLLVACLGMLSIAAHGAVRAQPTAPIYFRAELGKTLSGVVAASGGDVYLTFTAGGTHGLGTVARRDHDGVVTVLHAFEGPEGASPEVPLRSGPDGAFYGTTSQGGRFGNGTAFRVTPGGELTTLHDFTIEDGGRARVPLLVEADGSVLGVTSGEYLCDCAAANSVNCRSSGTSTGKVFMLTGAATFQVLYEGVDRPGGGLMRASTGVLYGTMRAPYNGGAAGAVYRLSVNGRLRVSSPNTYPVFDPFGELFEASDGYVYGTRNGAVFRMSLDFEPRAVEYDDSRIDDGPFIAATMGVDGKQYFVGNSAALYRATRTGMISRLAILDPDRGSFTSGLAPSAEGLLVGRDDYLVRLSHTGASTIVEHFGFRAGYRLDALTLTSRNELYGTTGSGGEHNQGTLFRADARGELSAVHSFVEPQRSVSRLRCPFVEATDGALYAVIDGTSPSLVRVNTLAARPTLDVLHVFPEHAANDPPLSVSGCLFAGDDGMLYGNMEIGPRDAAGRVAIYRYDPVSQRLSILARVSFLSQMLRTQAGAFYGTRNSAAGVPQFFQVRSDGGLDVLHTLPAGEDRYPASLAEGPDGAIYIYATGPLDTSDRTMTTDVIYRWSAGGGFEAYHGYARPKALWLDHHRMSFGGGGEIYVSAAMRQWGEPLFEYKGFVVFPDQTVREYEPAASPFLMGTEARVYRARPVTSAGYGGFQLEPIVLTAADGVR